MDHSGHDMSSMAGMDMSSPAMASTPASAPATLSSSDMASMTMTGAMEMTMQMTFYASANVTLWFKKWHTTSAGPYIATLIGLFVLCLLQEALTTYRNAYHARHVKRITRQNDPPVVGGCGCGPDKSEFGIEYVAPQDPPRDCCKELLERTVLSCMYAVNLAISYLLMLAIMTFNVGYFVVIVAGTAIGFFIFFRRFESLSNSDVWDTHAAPAGH